MVVALAIVAQAGQPMPVPLPPAPPPPHVWTAETLTFPIVHFSCDMLAADRRRGRLDFVVAGGRAYAKPPEPGDLVRGFGRTRQVVQFGRDDLRLFRSPQSEDVSLTTGEGRFFVRFAEPPTADGRIEWRGVRVDYNRRLDRVITVDSVPGGERHAVGYCAARAEPQMPLPAQETGREAGR